MGVQAALLELNDGLRSLAAHAKVVAREAQRTPHDEDHFLAGTLYDAAQDAKGWLRAARKAARKALKNFADPAASREALSECQHQLERMRNGLACELRRRRRLADLGDLATRHAETWGGWAEKTRGHVRDLAKVWRCVDGLIGRCWREMAGRAAPVQIHNLVVGKQVIRTLAKRPRRAGK
jgi:hypothetical protein